MRHNNFVRQLRATPLHISCFIYIMLRFELQRLVEYSKEEMLKELCRVSTLVNDSTFTKAEFDKYAKVSSSTVTRHFGGWQQALTAAGLNDRYSGRKVTAKMKAQPAKILSNEQLIVELQRVAFVLNKTTLTMEELNQHSSLINAKVIKGRFGSWKSGLKLAGLVLTNLGKRYTDDDYFENMLTVWTYHARQPSYREMDEPPSQITSGAYEKKWGTWSRALLAFVERANGDLQKPSSTRAELENSATTPIPKQIVKNDEDRHAIKLGLRYSVLCRDKFKCTICGVSPATDIGCQLHVDHITAFSRGGKTVIENLRTLCQQCNLGKGSKFEPTIE